MTLNEIRKDILNGKRFARSFDDEWRTYKETMTISIDDAIADDWSVEEMPKNSIDAYYEKLRLALLKQRGLFYE